MTVTLVAGIFVGGASRRMGGRPKGLLPAPDGGGASIVERSIALARAVTSEVVLVGAHAAYAHLGLPLLDDAAAGAGPLGGLVALLRRAGDGAAVAIACDMPRVTPALIARLATAEPDAAIVAPRDPHGGRWQPLFARYHAPRVLADAERRLAARELSLQPLLDAQGARELALDDGERRALDDWDAPEDIA